MSIESRIKNYMKNEFTGVMHTTLNPEGPGVIRIHLVPPKDGDASVAIINGQDIIPVNTSWSILLSEFIKEVNKFEGKPMSDADVEGVIDSTAKAMRKIFPLLPKKNVQ